MVADGRLTLPETISFPIDRYKDALAFADDGSSKGKKVLIQLSPSVAPVPQRAGSMSLTNA
jgi:hypothetical protein